MSRVAKRVVWGGVVGLFIVPVLGLLIERQVTRVRGERRLSAAVAALDAEEPGWRVDALYDAHNRGLPPPQENAAEIALSASRMVPASYKEWRRSNKWRWEPAAFPAGQPDGEYIRRASAVHADCEKALAVARTVHQYPRGGFKLESAYPNPYPSRPSVVETRLASDLLDFDALMLAATGQGDDAIRSVHAILAVARGIGNEPHLVAQMMRSGIGGSAKNSAERTLAWGEPTHGLAELQAAFAAEAVTNRMSFGLRGERAAGFALVEALDRGDVGSDVFRATDGPNLVNRAALVALSNTIPGQQADRLDLFGRYIKADQLTGTARRAAIDAITLLPKPSPNRFFNFNLGMASLPQLMADDDQTRALLGAAAVGVACERYRQRFGRWPAALAAIPVDILPAIPEDPYTGGPLRCAALPDGVAVYAVGPDKADDGGGTPTAAGKPGDDVGFRLWNPGKRRRPSTAAPTSEGSP